MQLVGTIRLSPGDGWRWPSRRARVDGSQNRRDDMLYAELALSHPQEAVRKLDTWGRKPVGSQPRTDTRTAPAFARGTKPPSQVTRKLLCNNWFARSAKVAELADAPDLGSGGETHGGSSPPFRTNNFQSLRILDILKCAQFCANLIYFLCFPAVGLLRLGSSNRDNSHRRERTLYGIRLRVDVSLSDRDRAVPSNAG